MAGLRGECIAFNSSSGSRQGVGIHHPCFVDVKTKAQTRALDKGRGVLRAFRMNGHRMVVVTMCRPGGQP